MRGTRADEVVIRQSRNWGAADLMKGVKQGQQNAFFRTKVLPAIDARELKKTGYYNVVKQPFVELFTAATIDFSAGGTEYDAFYMVCGVGLTSIALP